MIIYSCSLLLQWCWHCYQSNHLFIILFLVKHLPLKSNQLVSTSTYQHTDHFFWDYSVKFKERPELHSKRSIWMRLGYIYDVLAEFTNLLADIMASPEASSLGLGPFLWRTIASTKAPLLPLKRHPVGRAIPWSHPWRSWRLGVRFTFRDVKLVSWCRIVCHELCFTWANTPGWDNWI